MHTMNDGKDQRVCNIAPLHTPFKRAFNTSLNSGPSWGAVN